MKPISPVIPNEKHSEVIVAEHQERISKSTINSIGRPKYFNAMEINRRRKESHCGNGRYLFNYADIWETRYARDDAG